MLSKFCVRVLQLPYFSVRYAGGLSPLEKYERLRQLCCTSDKAKMQEEYMKNIRPQEKDVDPCDVGSKTCPDVMAELLNIRSKMAMVVGGATGIGFETADALLAGGVCKAIVADLSQADGITAVKKLCAKYGDSKAIFLATDIQEQPSIEMAFKEVYNCFGQLDIFVNAWGIYNETPQCWDQMVRANLTGCVRGTLLAYKFMSKNMQDDCNQGSVILNVSSYGFLANVPSMPLYAAASNGINGLTSSFGHDFHYQKSKVRCITVCPACTDSELLKNMSRRHYDPSWAGFSNAAMKCCTRQSAKIVGKAIVNAIRFGPNGAVFVVKEGKYYRYLMPDYEKILRQETILF